MYSDGSVRFLEDHEGYYHALVVENEKISEVSLFVEKKRRIIANFDGEKPHPLSRTRPKTKLIRVGVQN